MKILIIGESGMGKSNLSDIIRNGIFKADGDSRILVNDPSRESKVLGNGKNEYQIDVRNDEQGSYDVVINLKTSAFADMFRELY